MRTSSLFLVFLIAVSLIVAEPIPAKDLSPEEKAKKDQEKKRLRELAEEHGKYIYIIEASKFHSLTANGIWFIYFGANWCKHCWSFTPIWRQFQDTHRAELEEKGVKIGKFECGTEEGKKVCYDEYHMDGFPSLRLFKDGKFVEEYWGLTEEIGPIHDWVVQQLGKLTTAGAGTDSANPPKEAVKMQQEQKQEQQHNKVSQEVTRWKSTKFFTPPSEAVTQLTTTTFKQQVATGAHFVKFFAPWCGHCKALAPTWKSFGEDVLKSGKKVVISHVNCDVDGAVCQQFGVRAYPTLKLLFPYPPSLSSSTPSKESDEYTIIEYKGDRNIDAFNSFISKHVDTSVEALGLDDLKLRWKATSSNKEGVVAYEIGKVGDDVVKSWVSSVTPFFERVYILPLDSITALSSLVPDAKTIPSSPSLRVVVRSPNNDKLKLIPASSPKDMIEKIKSYQRPMILELTEDTSDEVLNSNGFVVLCILPITATREQISNHINTITEVVTNFKIKLGTSPNEFLFVYIHAQKYLSYLERIYGYDTSQGDVVIVSRPTDEEYITGEWKITKDDLLESVSIAQQGQSSSTSNTRIQYHQVGGWTKRFVVGVKHYLLFGVRHPFITLFGVVGVLVALLLWLRNGDEYKYKTLQGKDV